MSTDWIDDPHLRWCIGELAPKVAGWDLPIVEALLGEAVEAYKRTKIAEIEDSAIWYDADYTVEGLRAAVLAVLEES